MRILFGAALLLAGTGTATLAQAQAGVEGRVDRLEREMRAVQRKVFPGGGGATVEPDITARPVELAPGTPAGSALTDMTARVSALENGVRSVTGQVEQTSYRLRQLEDAFAAYKRTTDARLKALEDGATTIPSTGAAPAAAIDPPAKPAATKPVAEKPAAAPAATNSRAALVKAVEKPDTGDAAEDGYLYGYRLWDAKLYPESIVALKAVADKYPKHRRASFAQNLLGRAYLDDGKPSLASLAFYDSYKKFPDGERAPDSLYYLAQALTALKKPSADICKVYGELTDVYGSKISASMKADVEKGRAAQKCK